jgi:hypothetical protein
MVGVDLFVGGREVVVLVQGQGIIVTDFLDVVLLDE